MPRHRPQDHFGHKAKLAGYPARSVYKLQEIDRKLRLFRPGQRVLDLGAAPGSWSLYSAERVGPQGSVLAIDLAEIRVAMPNNVCCTQLDIDAFDPEGASFDVVLSDMAPKTSGVRQRDQYLSFELYMKALGLAQRVLASGGQFVGKIFQGPEFEEARTATQRAFQTVRIVKPEASRSESYEIFLVGSELKR